MKSRPIPPLPADIVQTIFDFIAGFEENPLVAQQRWVTLSLVGKEWARLAMRYRGSIILPTPTSVQRFVSHASKLLSDGIKLRELRVENIGDLGDLLRRIYPLLPQTLRSVSIPLELLHSQEVIDLLKPDTCKLEKVHLVGDALHDISKYTGDSMEIPDVLRQIPTLLHLELANVAFEGGPTVPDSSISGHFKTLHLRNIYCYSEGAAEQLANLFGDVQHLCLSNVHSFDSTIPTALCQILGQKLLSLRLDRASMRNLEYTCFTNFFSEVPVLESIELDGADLFDEACFPGCFAQLPQSLRHCIIGPVDWNTASAYMENRKDPNYLPDLLPTSIIWIHHGARELHKVEVDEYNLRRSSADPDDPAYTFMLRWDDQREDQEIGRQD